MTHQQRMVLFAVGFGIAVVIVKETLIGDPRWWNLVMVGLLSVCLVLYPRQSRRGQR